MTRAACRLPITAIVASHNEARLLPACLSALAFCDELIVIDIASSDSTSAVAAAYGARVLQHTWVPIAEQARAQAVVEARHDWLLIRDPDEIVPEALAGELRELFDRLEPDVGIVAAPTQRFFAGRPLRGGVWGQVKSDRLLAKRGLVEFPTAVHRRLIRKPGCREIVIPYSGDNAILHYWESGWRSFVTKHWKYLRLEGPHRAEAGEVTGARVVLATPARSLREYLRQGGLRDGLRGAALGLAWSAYRTGAELSLLLEQRRRAGTP